MTTSRWYTRDDLERSLASEDRIPFTLAESGQPEGAEVVVLLDAQNDRWRFGRMTAEDMAEGCSADEAIVESLDNEWAHRIYLDVGGYYTSHPKPADVPEGRLEMVISQPLQRAVFTFMATLRADNEIESEGR